MSGAVCRLRGITGSLGSSDPVSSIPSSPGCVPGAAATTSPVADAGSQPMPPSTATRVTPHAPPAAVIRR